MLRKRHSKPKPTHYKTICISMYNADLDLLDSMVKELKARGHTRMNKSRLLRIALQRLSLDDVPAQV